MLKKVRLPRLNLPQRIIIVIGLGLGLGFFGLWAATPRGAALGWVSYAPLSSSVGVPEQRVNRIRRIASVGSITDLARPYRHLDCRLRDLAPIVFGVREAIVVSVMGLRPPSIARHVAESFKCRECGRRQPIVESFQVEP